MGLLVRNRDLGSRGHSHGGVGIAFCESTCSFRELQIHNPNNFEVLAALGNIPGHARRMLAIACYMPPGATTSRGHACLDFIEDLLIKFKRKYSNPFIVVAGDFNQWKVEDVMGNFLDMTESCVGPTRGNRCIDRTFTNFGDQVKDAGTCPP